MQNNYLEALEQVLQQVVRSHSSEFVQQLESLLRDFPEKDSITCRVFKEVVDEIDTLLLIQLYGNTKNWFDDTDFNNAASLKIQGSIKTSLVDRGIEMSVINSDKESESSTPE